MMKRIGLVILAIVLLTGLCACNAEEAAGAGERAGASAESPLQPSPEPEEYIWTITIDDEQNEVVDAEVGASIQSRLRLSMSKEGGDEPYGVYRGEIEYSYDLDFGMLDAYLKTNDANGWGKSDAFTIELLPYDEIDFEAFEAGVAAVSGNLESAGEETESAGETEETQSQALPSLAPLVNAYAMHLGDNLEFTEMDFSTDVSIPEGLLNFQSDNKTAYGSVNLGSLFSASAGGEYSTPYSIVLNNPAELPVQFTLYGEHNFVYRGTIDRVPLSETVSVEGE